jgi:hypothetical protein
VIFETLDGRTEYELLGVIYLIDRRAHLLAEESCITRADQPWEF